MILVVHNEKRSYKKYLGTGQSFCHHCAVKFSLNFPLLQAKFCAPMSRIFHIVWIDNRTQRPTMNGTLVP